MLMKPYLPVLFNVVFIFCDFYFIFCDIYFIDFSFKKIISYFEGRYSFIFSFVSFTVLSFTLNLNYDPSEIDFYTWYEIGVISHFYP